MKNNCYDWRYDPMGRMLVASVLAAALDGDTYLVFEKKEWIPDNGFLFHQVEVYVPRGLDGKGAKIKCFQDCLHLLSKGYSNPVAEKNEQMMREYLKEQEMKL